MYYGRESRITFIEKVNEVEGTMSKIYSLQNQTKNKTHRHLLSTNDSTATVFTGNTHPTAPLSVQWLFPITIHAS